MELNLASFNIKVIALGADPLAKPGKFRKLINGCDKKIMSKMARRYPHPVVQYKYWDTCMRYTQINKLKFNIFLHIIKIDK